MAIQITAQTVLDADAYFATRLNSAGWTSASEGDQLASLVTASNVLNAMSWRGVALSPLYAFPRYLPDGPRTPVTPTMILWALYEEALHLLNNPGLLVEEDGVETLVVGPVQLQQLTSVDLIPKIVKRYIGPYTDAGGPGNGTWWRAN